MTFRGAGEKLNALQHIANGWPLGLYERRQHRSEAYTARKANPSSSEGDFYTLSIPS
jgi:hypothetical protein